MHCIEQKLLIKLKNRVRIMNKWSGYEVILKALSPIHLGYKKMGVVDLTRRYIPGKNLWGAATAVKATMNMDTYDPNKYLSEGKYIRDNFRFSCFYPYDLQRQSVVIPTYQYNCLEYLYARGNDLFSAYEFESQYISSYASTSINGELGSAREHTLHEIEHLVSGLSFKGYVFYKTSLQDTLVCDLINKLTTQGLGGDRSRGFGRVRVVEINKLPTEGNLFNLSGFGMWKWQFDSKDEELCFHLEMGEKDRVLALLPIVFDKSQNTNFQYMMNFIGDIEPIVGREWSATGAGQKFSEVIYTITPGSVFQLKELALNSSKRLKMNAYGYVNMII